MSYSFNKQNEEAAKKNNGNNSNNGCCLLCIDCVIRVSIQFQQATKNIIAFYLFLQGGHDFGFVFDFFAVLYAS